MQYRQSTIGVLLENIDALKHSFIAQNLRIARAIQHRESFNECLSGVDFLKNVEPNRIHKFFKRLPPLTRPTESCREQHDLGLIVKYSVIFRKELLDQ